MCTMKNFIWGRDKLSFTTLKFKMPSDLKSWKNNKED